MKVDEQKLCGEQIVSRVQNHSTSGPQVTRSVKIQYQQSRLGPGVLRFGTSDNPVDVGKSCISTDNADTKARTTQLFDSCNWSCEGVMVDVV